MPIFSLITEDQESNTAFTCMQSCFCILTHGFFAMYTPTLESEIGRYTNTLKTESCRLHDKTCPLGDYTNLPHLKRLENTCLEANTASHPLQTL